jgi:hypothetical protein
MIQVDENRMRDVKAGIALEIAKMLPKKERVAAVKGTLRCDEEEARFLIARGRRIAKLKVQAA